MEKFKNNKIICLTLLLLVIGLVGCKKLPPIKNTNQNTNINQNLNANNENIILEGNNILDKWGAKRGFLKDGKLFIYINSHLLSFEGDVNKLSFGNLPEFKNGFMYDYLTVTTEIHGPQEMYKPVTQDTKISYHCGNPFLYFRKSEKPVNFYYCETNGQDTLSQYEFAAAHLTTLSTGAEPGEEWKKIYVKKMEGNNIFFIGKLKGEYVFDYSDYNRLSSKEYLDSILKEKINQERVREWNELILKIILIID